MASQYGVMFNGRRIIHPGAYDATKAEGITVITGGSMNIPIMVGTAESGESGKVMWYSDSTSLKNDLVGGDLVTASELLFSPIPEGGGGASVVGVVVANPTTQASLTKAGIKVSAKKFGESGNRIQTKLEDGTTPGSKKFTVQKWDTEEIEVFDNLGALLSLQYTGSQAYAGLTITATAGVAEKLEVKIGDDEATSVVDLTLDLTSERFATVEDIARYISSISGYNVSYVDYSASATLSSSKLDAMALTPIKDSSVYVMGVAGDVINQVNAQSQLVVVETAAGALINYTYSYLAGGARGTTPGTWATHFDTIKKEFSDILVVLSGSEAIHAEALSHVQQMENRQQKQMLFTGGVAGETVAQTKARASALNSSRAVLAYPGIFHKAVSEGKKALAPYFTAAMIAGRVAGVSPSEPVTFDQFNLVGLEKDLLAGDPQVDELISSGVCTLERVQNGVIRLVQGITTYLGAGNTYHREISVKRGGDKLSNTMRTTMENIFVGQKGIRATASAVETKAIDVLEEALRDEEITGYRNIIVRFEGGAVYVNYEVAQVEPINWMLVTTHFVPDSTLGNVEEETI